MHISLAAERLFTIAGIPITNTLLVSWGIILLLFVIALLISKNLSSEKPKGLQNFIELIFEKLLDFMGSVTGSRKDSIKYFPLIATIFIFVVLSNLVEIIPGLGTIGIMEGEHGHETLVPFLRSSSADLNFTLAIAISAVLSIQIFGIAALGFFKYWKKFFCPPWEKPYFIGTFIGILELIAEVAKVISFSFRLFGNIFAGEVLLTVVLVLVPYLAPLPFLFLEIFVGFIQAVVFSMLTLVFIKVATAHH
ncbi:ATP synthase F0 subunit A [bacterium]|nr:ATP synthase F0 subunit A [bacterium]|tara:strand:- start:10218 stop:10967 length:750 start_codon:yes stop_codon:yes gene_type:complete